MKEYDALKMINIHALDAVRQLQETGALSAISKLQASSAFAATKELQSTLNVLKSSMGDVTSTL